MSHNIIHQRTSRSHMSITQSDNKLLFNSVVIIDYDDTLFPTDKILELQKTTQFNGSIKSSLNSQELSELIALSLETLQLLKFYMSHYLPGNIFIVTASGNGWIEESLGYVSDIGYYGDIHRILFGAKKDEPKILMIHPPAKKLPLKEYKFKADNNMEFIGHDALDWKYDTIKEIFLNKVVDSEKVMNTFVVIGDSEFEYIAAQKLKEECDKIYVKYNNVFINRIKFKIEPSFVELLNEHIVLNQLVGIYENVSYQSKEALDMDLSNEIKTLELCLTKMKQFLDNGLEGEE